MEAIAALGLASNIVQFVSFASSLIKTTIEILRSSNGCTADILALDSLYAQLHSFNHELGSKHDDAHGNLSGPGSQSNNDITSLRSLSLLCKSDCEKLLKVVSDLKLQEAPKGRWKCFAAVLKATWRRDEIKNLETRLNRTQMTMTLHVCAIARYVHTANDDLRPTPIP